MTIAAPVSGSCAQHPDAPATWTCHRCGRFVCASCERRTRPEAPPLCPPCWDLRAQHVQTTARESSRKLHIGGLIFGVVSFFHPLLMIASAILNLRELLRKDNQRDLVWMNMVGLGLTGLAMLLWVVLIVFAVSG